jgi:hypothetical protein
LVWQGFLLLVPQGLQVPEPQLDVALDVGFLVVVVFFDFFCGFGFGFLVLGPQVLRLEQGAQPGISDTLELTLNLNTNAKLSRFS